MRSMSVRNRPMLAIAAAALAVGALLGSSSGFAAAGEQPAASLQSAGNSAAVPSWIGPGVAPESLPNCTPPSHSASLNAEPLDWWC
jgi:hypothetical protein